MVYDLSEWYRILEEQVLENRVLEKTCFRKYLLYVFSLEYDYRNTNYYNSDVLFCTPNHVLFYCTNPIVILITYYLRPNVID